MSMNQQFWKEREQEFERTLAEFERCLETPFVPGEVKSWFDEIRRAQDALKPNFQLQTRNIHTEEFAEMIEEDPGLFGRVEEMEEEDLALAGLMQAFEAELQRLDNEAKWGVSESDLKEELEELVARGLELVVRLRKQKVAIETWLVEAFTRDRGTVD